MRTNLPVTQQEYPFPAHETLLSTTDTESHITYANAAFVRTSGYAVHELIGQPHNLVRHPDMPAEAFADMWRTLKDGQSWRALVKNRRQNGDHYWVCANAAPMRRNGQLTGYLSVRTHPQRSEVDAATQLYARVKAGQATGLAFHRGLVVRTGLMRWASGLACAPAAAGRGAGCRFGNGGGWPGIGGAAGQWRGTGREPAVGERFHRVAGHHTAAPGQGGGTTGGHRRTRA